MPNSCRKIKRTDVVLCRRFFNSVTQIITLGTVHRSLGTNFAQLLHPRVTYSLTQKPQNLDPKEIFSVPPHHILHKLRILAIGVHALYMKYELEKDRCKHGEKRCRAEQLTYLHSLVLNCYQEDG